ncbi:hypothetical protein [Microbacterium sp.]|uniref:hypothetical protein n=1 Tax=Microbacterium sp. TaxID=51671 RepID=UPI003C706869
MTDSTLWRDDDPEVFRGTILAAAERLGVQPLAVDKDYWVREGLRAITTAHPGEPPSFEDILPQVRADAPLLQD